MVVDEAFGQSRPPALWGAIQQLDPFGIDGKPEAASISRLLCASRESLSRGRDGARNPEAEGGRALHCRLVRKIPAQVILADWTALGNGSLSSVSAETNS